MKKLDSNLLEIINPRINREFYGFDNIEKLFLNILRNKKLLNAYIFYGIKGIGKATFAFRLSRFILSQNKNFNKNLYISKEDPVFKTVASLTHPDFILIESENNKNKEEISTELLKTIQEKVYKTCAESEYKIIVIDSIDDIKSKRSSNTLLKILEDCPQNCIFFIISHSIFQVPKTIKSRCQKIYFNPINNEKFKNWFKQFNLIDEKSMNVVLSLSNGSLGKAMEIINSRKYIEIYHKSNELIQNIQQINLANIEELFSLYNSNEVCIKSFLLIIQYQISKNIKQLIIENNKIHLVNFYLSLFFEINAALNLFKSFTLDSSQLLNIIKFLLLKHSKNL